MKKLNYLFVALAIQSSCFSQTQEPVTVVEDPIFDIADSTGANVTWDFSAISFENYPNTSDSDFVQRLDPSTVYASAASWPVFQVLTGELPATEFEEDGLTLILIGSYVAINEGHGNLNIPGEQFTDVDKIKWTENYAMLFAGDTVATYSNTYFAYFKTATHHKLFEVFKKHRAIGDGSLNYIKYGVSDCISCSNIGDAATINMFINPNPASGETSITYDLWESGNVIITITDQSGVVNTILFSGLNNEGGNTFAFDAQSYVTGMYTIHVSVDSIDFSMPLIIQ